MMVAETPARIETSMMATTTPRLVRDLTTLDRTSDVGTSRHTRYQAAVLRDADILLVCCAYRDGRTVWMLPGGGREDDEDEETCVVREVHEETGLAVRVERLMIDCPAEPPDGFYVRWRTYLCSVVGGQAAPGGGEGASADLVDLMWLSIRDDSAWPAGIQGNPILLPQLRAIRVHLEIGDGASDSRVL